MLQNGLCLGPLRALKNATNDNLTNGTYFHLLQKANSVFNVVSLVSLSLSCDKDV